MKLTDLIIRSETARDFDHICTVHDEAFGQDDEGKLVNRIRKGPNFIPELSIVVELEGLIIGHCLLSRIYIKSAQWIDTLGLAPVAILPKFQGQGIGSSLIEHSIRVAQDIGHPSVIVLGHPQYYPKFGFVKASEFGISCPFEVADEAFMALELIPHSLQDSPGEVCYPKEFGI